MDSTQAIAHPNIALVKYWGKQERAGNFPATPNVSITLSTLTTHTQVADAETDGFFLSGVQMEDNKINKLLAELREVFTIQPLRIDSHNNFPTGAGLASSASGVAALVTAINAHCQLGLSTELLSGWARRGSASAARSICGGFVALVPPLWSAQSLYPIEHWPLNIIVAVTSEAPKAITSTLGMDASRLTSPFYKTWLNGATDDFAEANDAIARQDFPRLGAIAELNCLKMHSVMLTTQPTLNYWNPATIACMETVRKLREQGHGVFFTIDAGPQVKAICLPDDTQAVQTALDKVPGVIRTINCTIGTGARVLEPSDPYYADSLSTASAHQLTSS